MSLLNFLQFQPIDPSSDQDEISSNHQQDQQIDLSDSVDEEALEAFWAEVEQDIQNDPEWFTFSDK